MNFIFRCRTCGHEEEISWARVPAAKDGTFVKELMLWCTECAQMGDGQQVFIDTKHRVVPGVEIIKPEYLN